MGTETWIAFGALLLAFITAIIGAAVLFQRGYDRSEANKESIDDIHRRKALMNNAIDKVTQGLADFKEYVAAHYAPMSALEKMEERVMNALNNIDRKLDKRKD